MATTITGTTIDVGPNKLVANSAGNVGIGTASPAKPLDVTGDIRTSTGILFGTDTAAANTLDDYEEGTWTPAFGRNGGTQPSVVYNEQVGSYTKVGNMVFLTGDMGVNSISIPSNGTLTITGMPFTKSSAHNPTGSFTSSQFNLYRARGQLVHVDNTKLGFLGQASATGQGGWDWEPVSALDGNESLRFAITYQV